MRRLIGSIALMLAVALGVPAQAQHAVEASFGLSIPTGDLSEYWNSSLTLNGGFYLETSPFTMLGFCGGFNKFGLDKDAYNRPSNYQISGGDLSVFSFCAEGRVKTGSMHKAHFYAGIGGGLYSVGTSDLTQGYPGDSQTTTFDRKNQIGGFLGGGATYPVSTQIKMGVKGQVHFFSVGDDHGFEDIGETRAFYSLQFLLMYFM